MTAPRGRRPAGQDTRAAVVRAARTLFAEQGYEATSFRAVAREAGVDPRTVHHWFDSKVELFLVTLSDIPFTPSERLASVLAQGREGIGERVVTTFVRSWDERPEAFVALVQATGSAEVLEVLRRMLVQQLFAPAFTGLDHAEERMAVVASQLLGLAMTRWVLALPGVREVPAEALARWYGPQVQRAFDADVSDLAGA